MSDLMIEEWEGFFFFPAESLIFADHVPGAPVIPGSVIVHAFLDEIHRKYPQDTVLRIERFRFRHFAPPGQYLFRMRAENSRIRCELFTTEQRYATGTLLCARVSL